MNPAQLLADPEFASLPPDRQAAMRQEALGHIIIDPDFQELQKTDPGKAINFLFQVNSAGARQTSTGEPIEDQPLQEPGEGQGFLRSLVDPGVLLEPSGLVAGAAVGKLAAGRVAQAGQKAVKGTPEPTSVPSKTTEPIPTEPLPEPAPSGVTPTAQPAEIVEPVVSLARGEEVKQAVLKDVHKLAETEAAKGGERLFKQVAEAIDDGTIDVDGMAGVLERSGMSLQEFAQHWKTAQTTYGKGLQKLSVIRKKLNALAETNPDAAAALSELEGLPAAEGKWETFKAAYKAVDNVRRGLMVGQLSTTVRNVLSQSARYGVEVIDSAIESGLKGEAPEKALELTSRFFANLKPGAAKEVMKVLENFPVEEAKLLGSPIGEASLGNKAVKLVNTLNTMQERFFRRTAFDATVRTKLKEAGMDVEQALANPASIPEEIIQDGVKRALDVTFAAAAKPGTFAHDLMKAYDALPMLTTINPYPRFWGNSMQFLMEHNPAGLLMGREPTKENIAKSLTGTAMLAGALVLREKYEGGKWYEAKDGDNVIDTRSYAPFSSFMFLADVLKTVSEAGEDVIKDGRTLKQALIDHGKYTSNDLLQATAGINRIAGSGLVVIDLINKGSMDRKMDIIRDFAAQYLSGFTVPARTPKDIVAGFSPEEATLRDVREDVLAPTKANFPGVSQTLPAKPSPTQGKQPETEHPLLRQFAGVSLRSARLVGDEIDRLGVDFSRIAPATGDAEIDRELSARMGPMADTIMPNVIQSPMYHGFKTEEQRRFVLTASMGYIRSQALQQLKEQRPDLEQRLKLDQTPENIRRLLISVGGPDLKELAKPSKRQ
jgi:hypothetical protein